MTKAGGKGSAEDARVANAAVEAVDAVDAVAAAEAKVERQRAHLKGAEEALAQAIAAKKGRN